MTLEQIPESLRSSPEQMENREKVCIRCKFRDPRLEECKICSCPLSQKYYLKFETCPREYWNE